MYDSIDPYSIPIEAPAVAGYIDGRVSQWPSAAWFRFDTPLLLHICTYGPRKLGDTLDIERGDSVPSEARPWAMDAQNRGVVHPKLYMSVSDYPEVLSLTEDLDCRYWTAHYTNVPHLCDSTCNPKIKRTADATQWSSNPAVTGGNYDLSICTDALFD